jgi:phosphonoacetate hydrolase
MSGREGKAIDRRGFLAATGVSLMGLSGRGTRAAADRAPKRVVILMCDGLGLDYVAASQLPTLERWKREGTYKDVTSVMPTVTNANNASILCGSFPEEHGITGNTFLDEKTGREEYMESADLVRSPTLFRRAAGSGVKSALLTAKKKTASLFGRDAEVVVVAESPAAEHVQRWGKAPDIYSREINHWVLRAAVDLLKTHTDLGCLYIHTTDYPMHHWPPEASESKDHLAKLDALLAEAEAAAPDAALLVTADHGLNHKSQCWDLARAMGRRGLPLRAAISAERDKYLVHHRGFGGTSWVYLKRPGDAEKATALLRELDGVERVLTRAEAAKTFRLMSERIGELVVLGDRRTVFGELIAEPGREAPEREDLPESYRSHGSLYEADVPLVVYNAPSAPPKDSYRHNLDIARWLYRTA